jgi:predicted O-methyltransferase YrrM
MQENVTWRPHPQCPHPHHLWSAPDGQSTEHEVTDFISAFVRLVKPTVAIETGTYHARTATAIAVTMARNGVGHLTTYENDPQLFDFTRAQLQWNIDRGIITFVNDEVRVNNLPENIDFAFLDSGMEVRAHEMTLVWPRVRAGGFVMVHDAAPSRPPGLVRPEGAFHLVEFATPRGLNLFQKPWG